MANNIITKTFEAIEGFLSITCKPALEEIGLMMSDKVRVWRLNNVLKIIEKSKNKLEFRDNHIQFVANPKVALAIIENGSNEESDELQEMWAGLFVASLSENGSNDDVITYVNILKQISSSEAKLLKHICEVSKKGISDAGLPIVQTVSIYSDQISVITQVSDLTELESILNHFNSLRLSEKRDSTSSFAFRTTSDKRLVAWLTPTSLALSLYVKCQGFKGTVSDYWSMRKWTDIQKEQNESIKGSR
jgi:hypothetical protein